METNASAGPQHKDSKRCVDCLVSGQGGDGALRHFVVYGNINKNNINNNNGNTFFEKFTIPSVAKNETSGQHFQVSEVRQLVLVST